MSRFWSPVVHTLSPYVPGEQPKQDGIVKLNTNENPYPPSPRVLAAIASAAERLRLYPDPRATRLREAIAAHCDVAPEQVFVGNGSDEVLAHTFQALLKHDAPLLFPDVTYSFYPVYCGLYGIAHDEVPLDAAMRIDISDYRRPSSAILLCNPNAPTGTALQRDAIASLLAEQPDRLVVVDEAYVDFGAESAVPLVARHDNLLVDPDLLEVALARWPAGWFCHRPTPADRSAGTGEGQLQLLSRSIASRSPAPSPRSRTRLVQETRARIIASRETLARDSQTTRLRGVAVARKLRLRAPSKPERSRSRGRASRARRSGAAFRKAAHRGLPAHHGRDGR